MLGQNMSLAYAHIKTNDDFIFSKIGRKSTITVNLPPEKNFEKKIEDNWPTCKIFININNSPETGQMIAFESKSSVFHDPSNALRDLVDHLNHELNPYGYVLNVNPVTIERNFWGIVKQYSGKIEELDFRFAAPNLLNIKNSLNEDLHELQDEIGITNAEISLKNKDGLLIVNPDNEFIKQSVDYVTKGGGSYKLKIKAKLQSRVITSDQNIKTRELDIDIDTEINNNEAFNVLMNQIFQIKNKLFND